MEPNKPDFVKLLQEGKLKLSNGKIILLDSDETDEALTDHQKKLKAQFRVLRQSMQALEKETYINLEIDHDKLNEELIEFYNNSNVQTDEYAGQFDFAWQFLVNAKYRIDGQLSGKASVNNGFICMEGRVYNST